MIQNILNRRTFVKAGLASVAIASMPKLVMAMSENNVFHLTAKKTNYALVSGAANSELWTFNDIVSGPEIRVVKGREITVIFKNELDEPTSIHWHGIRIDNKMDGVSGLTQDAVLPGEEYIYTFTVPDAGSFWYHAHNMSWSHVARGLYGALIVDEITPLFDKDHDITLMLDDWKLDSQGKLDIKSLGSLMEWAHAGRLGNLITVNGKFRPEIKLKQNENYRIRIINVANSRVSAFDINQLDAKIIAYDGQTLVSPRKINYSPLIIGPAQRVDLLITPKKNEPFKLIDLGSNEPYEIAEFIIEPNLIAPPPVPKLVPNKLLEPDIGNAIKQKIEIQGGAMSGMRAPIYRGEQMSMMDSMRNKQVWALNGIANLGENPMFEVKRDQTIIIDFLNDTSFMHAMHIHGHHFKILSRNGTTDNEQAWRDTFMIGPESTTTIAFVANNPGKWLLHCHMLEHASGGMNTWFKVS